MLLEEEANGPAIPPVPTEELLIGVGPFNSNINIISP